MNQRLAALDINLCSSRFYHAVTLPYRITYHIYTYYTDSLWFHSMMPYRIMMPYILDWSILASFWSSMYRSAYHDLSRITHLFQHADSDSPPPRAEAGTQVPWVKRDSHYTHQKDPIWKSMAKRFNSWFLANVNFISIRVNREIHLLSLIWSVVPHISIYTFPISSSSSLSALHCHVIFLWARSAMLCRTTGWHPDFETPRGATGTALKRCYAKCLASIFANC